MILMTQDGHRQVGVGQIRVGTVTVMTDYFCLASTYMLGAVCMLGPEVLNALVLSFECDYATRIPCPLPSGIPCALGTSPVAFPFH